MASVWSAATCRRFWILLDLSDCHATNPKSNALDRRRDNPKRVQKRRQVAALQTTKPKPFNRRSLRTASHHAMPFARPGGAQSRHSPAARAACCTGTPKGFAKPHARGRRAAPSCRWRTAASHRNQPSTWTSSDGRRKSHLCLAATPAERQEQRRLTPTTPPTSRPNQLRASWRSGWLKNKGRITRIAKWPYSNTRSNTVPKGRPYVSPGQRPGKTGPPTPFQPQRGGPMEPDKRTTAAP